MSTRPSNLYELLQVPVDANMSDIRRAYRRRALESHPDKSQSRRGADEETQTSAIPSPIPFVVVSAAANLLLDPMRRRQYDQLLFLNKLSVAGRISNSDEVEFGFEAQGGEFVVISDDEAEGNQSLDEPEDFKWCGLECRCGGWYRVAIPISVWDHKDTQGGAHLAPRTVHVECESCSLVIAVTKVPTLMKDMESKGTNNEFSAYVPLFLGLEAS